MAFGIYVHWPFCEKKCPYCDFNSHVAKTSVDQALYVRAFEREMQHYRSRTGKRLINSIFFGGGTPSLMEVGTVGHLLELMAKYWDFDSEIEITLEANPSSVEADRFKGYRLAGVNRLSLGIQALDDAALQALGRLHNTKEALTALEIAEKSFPRFSFDLIYARPHQTVQSWEEELKIALCYARDHISLYQLTIEEGTHFSALYKAGKLKLPDNEIAAQLYEITDMITAQHGLPAYEISNYAAKGNESKHNLIYWRYQEYIGLGPGAHSRFLQSSKNAQRTALINEKIPRKWLQLLSEAEHAIVEEEAVSAEQQAEELILMGLRLEEGVNFSDYTMLKGEKFPIMRVKALQEQGLLENIRGQRFKVTKRGRLLLNYITAELLA